MTTEVLTVSEDYLPLDLLLWRRFRSEAVGRVERTIGLNRGICEHVFLPVGSQVIVEIPDAAVRAPAVRVSRLWD